MSTNPLVLLSLPNELLIEIVEEIGYIPSVQAFMLVNKRLHTLLQPFLDFLAHQLAQSGLNPLFRVIKSGNFDSVKRLIEVVRLPLGPPLPLADENLEKENKERKEEEKQQEEQQEASEEQNAIFVAAATPHSDILQYLLTLPSSNPYINVPVSTFPKGLSLYPLHAASNPANDRNVTLLLDHGAEINAKAMPYQYTALHYISLMAPQFPGNVPRLLVEAGAEKDPRDQYGRTPLQVAVSQFFFGRIGEEGFETVRALVEVGCTCLADRSPIRSAAAHALHRQVRKTTDTVGRKAEEVRSEDWRNPEELEWTRRLEELFREKGL